MLLCDSFTDMGQWHDLYRVVVGAGDYYCSGNDLSNFTDISPQDIPVMAKKGGTLIRYWCTDVCNIRNSCQQVKHFSSRHSSDGKERRNTYQVLVY